MFGRQRQMSFYPPSLTKTFDVNSMHNFTTRSMPLQNSYYPQQPYNPYVNGMPTNQAAFVSPYYSNPMAHAPMEPNWHGGGYVPYGYEQKQNISQLLFENPLQSQQDNSYGGGYYPNVPNQSMNPYPQQAYLPKQPGGFQSVMNSFKNQEGNLDLNKMIDTAGQMMNAVNQVSSMVKGLGGFFKASV